MDSYGESIFCSTVDASVKNELKRRSIYYTSNGVQTPLFDWTTNKTAYVTATATVEVNNSVISSATLDNNKTRGGLFDIDDDKRVYNRYNTDIQSGKTSLASFLPNPIIKSAHIYSYGDLGELYQCRIEYTLFSHSDLSKYTAFFEIGGKLKVNYGWTKVGGSCNKATFDGIITNFSYNLAQDGSYECFTDAISPGTNILVSNVNSNSQTSNANATSTEDGKGDMQSVFTGVGPEIIHRMLNVGSTAPKQVQQNGILYMPDINKFDEISSNATANSTSNNGTDNQKNEDTESLDRIFNIHTEEDVYVLRHLSNEALNKHVVSYCKNVDWEEKLKRDDKTSYTIERNGKDKQIDLTAYYFLQSNEAAKYNGDGGNVWYDDAEVAFGTAAYVNGNGVTVKSGFINQPLKTGKVFVLRYNDSGDFKEAKEFTDPTLRTLEEAGYIKIPSIYGWMKGLDNVEKKIGNIVIISPGKHVTLSYDTKTTNLTYAIDTGNNKPTTGYTTLSNTIYDNKLLSERRALNGAETYELTVVYRTCKIDKIVDKLYDTWFINNGKLAYDISKYPQDIVNMIASAGVDVNSNTFDMNPPSNYYIQFKHLIEVINLTLLSDKKNRIYFDSPKNNQCFETNESFSQGNNQNNSNSDIKYTVTENTLPSDGCLVYFSDVKDDNGNSDLRASDGTIVFVSPDPKTLIYPSPFATYSEEFKIDLNCTNTIWGNKTGTIDGYKPLSDIFINCKYILDLLQSIGTPTTTSVDTTIRDDIMSLLQNIFNVIYTNSGNRFRLAIRQDTKNENYYMIYSMDTAYTESGGNVDVTEIRGVSNGSYLRSANISSEVPDSVASMVGIQNSGGQFTMSNNTTAGAIGRLFFNGVTGRRIESSAQIEDTEKKKANRQQAIDSFKSAIVHVTLPNNSKDDGTDKSGYNNFANVLRNAITTLYQSDMFENYPALIPIHFTFTLDGIHGFKFGDCVSFSYVPNLYKPSNHVFFNVIKIDHKIQDNEWVTEIDTILRYLPNTTCIVTATHTQRPYIMASSVEPNEYASNIDTVNLDEFALEVGKITTHFKVEDFLRTSHATIQQNKPTTAHRSNLENLIKLVDIIAAAAEKNNLGKIRIGSGYRNKYVNQKVGGAENSQHCKGEAADMTLGNKQNNRRLYDLILALRKKGVIEFDQLLWEYGVWKQYPSWVHISYKSDGSRANRNEVARIYGKGKYQRIYSNYK